MEWLLFTSQLPPSPSSLRVMLWRRMRAAGALGLQNGVWILPNGKEQKRFLQELLDYLVEQGASGQAFTATTLNPTMVKELLARFRAQRDEEYVELIERCDNLLDELAKETRKKKFTFAELEENEEDLRKLEVWLGRIKARDYAGGERAAIAAGRLEYCRKKLDTFAHRVYAREQVTSNLAES